MDPAVPLAISCLSALALIHMQGREIRALDRRVTELEERK